MVLRYVTRKAAVVAGGCPLFSMQLVVSVLGLTFSAAMLAIGRDPAIYLPVVTSIVGYWLPAPRKPDNASDGAADAMIESSGSVACVRREEEPVDEEEPTLRLGSLGNINFPRAHHNEGATLGVGHHAPEEPPHEEPRHATGHPAEPPRRQAPPRQEEGQVHAGAGPAADPHGVPERHGPWYDAQPWSVPDGGGSGQDGLGHGTDDPGPTGPGAQGGYGSGSN